MKTFPESIRFSKPWRPYQKRVLDELEEHLDDNHLHVIAAPGSGKTVLGLEVMRRLDRPALVFAPSLAIRDQWADRFVHLFCESLENARELVSRDLERPGLVTVSTYQGLHSAFSGTVNSEENEDEEDEHDALDEADDHEPGRDSTEALIRTFKATGIRTIIVDEALQAAVRPGGFGNIRSGTGARKKPLSPPGLRVPFDSPGRGTGCNQNVSKPG
jgi:superfamily II DNA or RNA helicase